ncbi:NAD(P)-dependent oxidoreductase [Janthinobacterium sp. Mn2066]|uniref:NAD(P)-dependent oxidoreductase n=1 Tax=Janthinobacterium sp. Mn2066 TaxID=3395264 RepID=UPI003BE58723
MNKITVLGLGAMGSRMAKQLINAGHCLTVWNRTPEAAQQLRSLGARQALSPREAAVGAEFVIAMLRDDDVSRQVWLDEETGALAGMAAGAVAIESSTLTPEWVRQLGAHAQQRGVDLLEAPVSGSRAQADAGQLAYLAAGDAAVLERSQPLLQVMGSSVHHIGQWGDGALAKLATNAMLGIQVTALAEIIGLLSRSGIDVAQVMAAMASTSVWAPVASYLSNTMLTANFAPQFPVHLIEKDFGYILREAGSTEQAPTIAAAHAVFLAAIANGSGQENMTSVAKLFMQPQQADS